MLSLCVLLQDKYSGGNNRAEAAALDCGRSGCLTTAAGLYACALLSRTLRACASWVLCLCFVVWVAARRAPRPRVALREKRSRKLCVVRIFWSCKALIYCNASGLSFFYTIIGA